MAARDPPFKPAAQRRARCRQRRAPISPLSSTCKSRSRPRSAASVEHAIELRRRCSRSTCRVPPPEDAARVSHDIGQPLAVAAREASDRHERGRLQLDAARPGIAQRLRTTGQEISGLRRQRIDVRADRARAVRVSAAKAELHAPAHVLGSTSAPRDRHDRARGAQRTAVGIRRARPDMALVEMGVEIDEARPDLAAGELDARLGRRRCRRRDARQCARPPISISASASPAVDIGSAGSRPRPGSAPGCARRPASSAPLGRERRRSPCPHVSSPALMRALVPAPQGEVRDQRQHQEDQDAGHRDQQQRREHARDLAACSPLRGCGRRGPTAAPPVPATNSATTAPISARPPADAQAAEEIGQRARQAQCQQHLPARWRRRAGTGRADCGRRCCSPSVVFDSDREEGHDPGADQQREQVFLTQMMISGAIATIGVTCRITA